MEIGLVKPSVRSNAKEVFEPCRSFDIRKEASALNEPVESAAADYRNRKMLQRTSCLDAIVSLRWRRDGIG